ncbi:MAG: manganese/zinc/iron transport system permease protein [Flavobacteriales bacterium]|jgi:manganese/zinc/iron transport system permease protein
MNWLIEPWLHGDWMWRAAAAITMVSLCTAPVGVVLYLRRESMLIDALAHTALPGIVFAVMLTGRINSVVLLFGAAATGVGAALLIQALAKRPNMRSDAAMGAVFTTLFALGVLLLSVRLRGIHLDAEHALYGNLLAVQNSSIIFLAGWSVLVWMALVGARRLISVACFDPKFALAIGAPMTAFQLVMMSATSLTAVACF